MSKPPIRLGDPTSHGGEVVSASSTTTFFGKSVALMGDRVSCPKQGHTNCVIVEGSSTWSINGKPVALDGHKTSCGAVLIATFGNVLDDQVGGGARSAQSGASLLSGASERTAIHDEQFVLKDATGTPMPQTYYTIKLPSGELQHGVTDDNGKTERIETDGPKALAVYLGHREAV